MADVPRPGRELDSEGLLDTVLALPTICATRCGGSRAPG